MPHAEANGQRLYYELDGDGEPLLLVMGLGADRLSWIPQLPDWSKQFKVVSFDNRDVGQSSYADGPYEVGDMAADALALADALDFDSFHLLGYSLGGAIAQEMALAAPERVRTLTLCVTWGGSGAWGRELARVWGPSVMRTPREEHIDDLLLRCFSEEFFEDAERVAFMRQVMLANPYPQAPEAFVRQLDASSRHETRDRVSQLSMPVHVIGAEYDVLVPVWKSQELADLIPGAKLSVVEAGAHALNLERTEEFNKLVMEFIAAEAAKAA